MLFWFIAFGLTLVVATLLILPLRGSGKHSPAPDPSVALYKAQLDELVRDQQRGVIDAPEAERARTEVARRLLDATSRATSRAAGAAQSGATLAGKNGTMLASLAVVAALGGALGLYALLGAPGAADLPLGGRIVAAEQNRDTRLSQADGEAQSAAMAEVTPDAPSEYLAMVEQLRAIVPTRPDELAGWQLLSRHEAGLGNYAAAARAQEQIIRIKGPATTAADLTSLLDRLVAATGGLVSPQSETLARQIEVLQPGSAAPLYYIGLMHAQTGRPDLAFTLWRMLIEQNTDLAAQNNDSLHLQLAQMQIEEAAFRAGVDYTLPEITAPRGPSAADVAAAQDMTDTDRSAMIEGMVAALSTRLAEQGGPAEDWAQLIQALGVLGRTEEASAIYIEAQTVFAGSDLALSLLQNAGAIAGLTQGSNN
ncbi:MAG: c-type cytochrome biogenesis protein CcmI [Rhodobacteraceae bacterium]|nr:c-type cytochrome biogenesis protein CcmI [Paracoccaceae bacterium]